MKKSNRLVVVLFMACVFVLGLLSGEAYANGSSQPPNIISSTISSRTVAYLGNSVPGFITIGIKTDKPSRGHIEVTGNNISTRINVSTIDFKTEHTVNWEPWDEIQRKPLPPGTYTLRLSLSDAELNRTQGYPLGTITVVEETNPKPLIEGVSVTPNIIKPIYAENKELATIGYSLNRHAEAQLIIRGYKNYHSPKVKLAPGTHSFKWNGRDNQGAIVPDGEYEVSLHLMQLNYNNPSTRVGTHKLGTIVVKDGEYGLPQYRIDEIIKEFKLDQNTISRKDGEVSKLTGHITVNENATVSVHVLNVVGTTINRLMEYRQVSPGQYSFTWDGRDMFSGAALNGTYYLKILVSDSQGAAGDRVYNNLPIKLVNGTSHLIPEPVQRVKVIIPEANMTVFPGFEGYKGKSGEIFTLLEDTATQDPDKYSVLVAGEIQGYVRKNDVELIDLEKIPVQHGYIANSDVKFEENPAYLGSSSEKAPIGASLRLLRKEGEWYRVVAPSGKQLYVRVTDISMEPVNPPVSITHTVVQGDTLWKISQQYSVPMQEIILANNLDVNKPLSIGQRLQIPNGKVDNNSPQNPQPPQSPQPPQNTDNVYVVKAGDTLWKIAQANSTTVNEIVALNKLNPQEHLFIGQRLSLPKAPVNPTNPTNPATSYTVKAGDTLWKIAQANNTTVNEIVTLNNLNLNNHLYVGQRLNLPSTVTPPPQTTIYTVKAGDSLWRIAQSHGTTVDRIVELNQLNPSQPIMVGQQLKL